MITRARDLTVVQTIRLLAVGVVLTALIAVAALAVALVTFEDRTKTIQTSRVDGRRDSCHVLKDLALHTVDPTRAPALRVYLAHSELANCAVYGRDLSGRPVRAR